MKKLFIVLILLYTLGQIFLFGMGYCEVVSCPFSKSSFYLSYQSFDKLLFNKLGIRLTSDFSHRIKYVGMYDGEYIYTTIGSFVEVKPNDGRMILRDKYGLDYSFQIPQLIESYKHNDSLSVALVDSGKDPVTYGIDRLYELNTSDSVWIFWKGEKSVMSEIRSYLFNTESNFHFVSKNLNNIVIYSGVLN